MKTVSLFIILAGALFTSSAWSAVKSNPFFYQTQETLPDGYKICAVGDIGTGSSSQDIVAAALADRGCDQVRVLGDVIYPNGVNSMNDKLFIKKFYKPYKRLLDNLNVPFYISMGNHDFRSSPEVWIDIAKKYENIIFPNFYYTHKWNDICFLSIETDMPSDRNQKRWVTENLTAMRESGCKIIAATGHHPFRSVGVHGNARGSVKRFLAPLMGKVDLLLSGHDHNLADEGMVQGTRLIVSGAGAKLRRISGDVQPGNYAESKNGFVELIVDRSQGELVLKYQFVTVAEEGNNVSFTGEITERPRQQVSSH